MNMKSLISTVDPPAACAALDAEVAEDAGELVPPLFELELHAVAADTAINATKTNSARRGRWETARAPAPIVRIMMCPCPSQTATQEKNHVKPPSQLHCWAFSPDIFDRCGSKGARVDTRRQRQHAPKLGGVAFPSAVGRLVDHQ
jgi:hypothetical protein